MSESKYLCKQSVYHRNPKTANSELLGHAGEIVSMDDERAASIGSVIEKATPQAIKEFEEKWKTKCKEVTRKQPKAVKAAPAAPAKDTKQDPPK
jgi:hypothetical protein